MIKIEITSSSNPYAIGLYEFDFDFLYIGRSKKNDLIFLDDDIPLRYLKIEIHKDNLGQCLLIKNINPQSFFFINGKKVKGSIRIRLEDSISFGKNEIIIRDFKKTNFENDLTDELEEFHNNHPELGFVLNYIEEEIVYEENKKLNGN